jgi:5-formyltetrahydrofolate cyclo-ligase
MLEKQALREKIWRLMEEQGIARFPLPCFGRIPNFEDSEKAAERLAETQEWKEARVIVANPDYAQKKVRELALRDGKILIMASPRLKHGYIKINPNKVKGKESIASTIKGAFEFGERIEKLEKPDLIITGCVAVNSAGYRLGKGGGYGDREIKTFKEKFGDIPVATTVHEMQIVEKIPFEEHDQRIDIIATPKIIIRVPF